MTEAKQLKRDIRTIWDALKRERRERSKTFEADALANAATRIASYATDLKAMAERLRALENAAAVPNAEDAGIAEEVKAKKKPKKPKKTADPA